MNYLAEFLDNPSQAAVEGYKPCYLDCLSLAASTVTFRNVKLLTRELFDLFSCKLYRVPYETVRLLLVIAMFITIPFGGFFVLGTLSWLFGFRPGILKPEVARQRAMLRKAFNDL